MNIKKLFIAGVVFIAGTVVYIKKRRTIPKGVKAVKPFDINKYLGKWYEIARLDFCFEHNIDYATAEYSMDKDGSIKVINKGYNYKKHKEVEAVGRASFLNSPDEGRFKISFKGPFCADYNVIAIDSKYKYALVTGRNHNYLWLLSKDTSIPEKIKESYLELAEDLGYNTSKIKWTKYK